MASFKNKKKLNRADYMFKDQENQELIKVPGQINGMQFIIANLKNCQVFILDHSSQITIDKCENCTFVIGPIKGSIFVRDCENCTVSVACQQFRCRDYNNSKLFLYVSSEPIIESSSKITFGPYNVAYPLLDKHAEECGFDTSANKWDLIFDFTESSSGEKNFQIMDPSEFTYVSKTVDSITDQPVRPFALPQKYGGSIPDDINQQNQTQDENIQSFKIGMSQQEAEAIYQQAQEQQQTHQQQQDSNNAFDDFMGMGSGPQMNTMQTDSMNTFQPATIPMQTNLSGGGNNSDYTQEELALMEQVQRKNQERMQNLYEKQNEEMRLKQERRQKAKQALDQFYQERQMQLSHKQQTNQDLERMQREQDQNQKTNAADNPWNRVFSELELGKGHLSGTTEQGTDIKRMQQAIIGRKTDITKSGGAMKNIF